MEQVDLQIVEVVRKGMYRASVLLKKTIGGVVAGAVGQLRLIHAE